MAEFKIGEVSGETKDGMVTTYAALILHDAEKEVNPDNINKLVAASGNTVEPYWPTLFSKLLQTFEMKDLLLSGGGGGGGAGGAGGAGGDGAAEEEEEEEEEEEIDMGGGGGLFGDDDGADY